MESKVQKSKYQRAEQPGFIIIIIISFVKNEQYAFT